jgi:hypothetical protein
MKLMDIYPVDGGFGRPWGKSYSLEGDDEEDLEESEEGSGEGVKK